MSNSDTKDPDDWTFVGVKHIWFVTGISILVNIQKVVCNQDGTPIVLVDDMGSAYNWSTITTVQSITGNVVLSDGRRITNE